MRYLFILMLFCTHNTEPEGMDDYLYQTWDEERWNCTATDRIEQTCGDLKIERKPHEHPEH
jgi:hypothetical protein